ncbi:class I SAM-dependent methyltransferase [Streptomyces sp. NPDC056632]|uniref:class I SAM-dependent methyltransferase n=1 Tax=Streptomyces sp. NPDC056632 TaxID=3345884 RepID=UPI0036C75131
MTADAPGGGRYGEDVFRPEAAGEGERIDFGALAYDDITMARLRALGAGEGWRCLDVGAGTGTVSRRLLEEAGVESVLAVDRDVRFLAERPVPGLKALEADVTAPDFAPGRFRLVHARFVLMHLPERERVIRALAELVEPGGVLVLSDAVDLTSDLAGDGSGGGSGDGTAEGASGAARDGASAAARDAARDGTGEEASGGTGGEASGGTGGEASGGTGEEASGATSGVAREGMSDGTRGATPGTPYAEVMRAMWRGLRDTIGTDVSWVPSYPHLLREAGLHPVAAEIHVPPLVPGSPISRFWADTWERSRAAMLATGLVDDAAVDAAILYLHSDECAALSAGMLTAWGRKPEEQAAPA